MEIVELVQKNMLDYSAAVNQSRAIPDARTGLKPIHRKILYEMYADKIKSSGKYKKCAYMVGQIIARFSEHGDAATYDALVRLAQPWIQRYPLLDFHGNYGSQFGDSAAAQRYTESKLSSLAEEGMLYGLNKQNVDWIPNFTNEEMEPVTLPAVFPGLFCLPNQGIGYAVACNFLTYNLNEVAALIENYLTTGELNDIVFDLASGGTIINPSVMKKIHATGKGSVLIEAKYHIEGDSIIITELPFNVMLETVYEEIVKFAESEENDCIVDIINTSGNGKLELIVKTSSAKKVNQALEILLERTKLRSSYNVNQVAIVNNKPQLLTLKDMVEVYISHNLSCIEREYRFDLQKALERLHILEAIIFALDHLDSVIYVIKNAENPKEELMKNFPFDEDQTKAILDIKLSRLAKLEVSKLIQEKKEKEELVDFCKEVISFREKRVEILISRLKHLVEVYGDSRRTEINSKEVVSSTSKKTRSKAKFEPQSVICVVNAMGYLKVIPAGRYRAQADKKNLLENKTQNDDMLEIFTDKGKMYRIALKNIKMCETSDKGIALGSILEFVGNEKILFANLENNPRVCDTLLFVTKKGYVKRTDPCQYCGSTQNVKGVKAIAFKAEEDEVVSIVPISEFDGITLKTETNSIHFCAENIRVMGKAAGGIKGINTDNQIISVSIGAFNKQKSQKPGGKGRKE